MVCKWNVGSISPVPPYHFMLNRTCVVAIILIKASVCAASWPGPARPGDSARLPYYAWSESKANHIIVLLGISISLPVPCTPVPATTLLLYRDQLLAAPASALSPSIKPHHKRIYPLPMDSFENTLTSLFELSPVDQHTAGQAAQEAITTSKALALEATELPVDEDSPSLGPPGYCIIA
ncbi:hypothetical protein PENSPDRAFT_365285 [Peniophora sp. CONT]|nr:hypothetical protein PENSPDRAFT_365285 [Peniophora sp. CONT]